MQFKSLFVFVSLPILLFAQTTPAQIESDISNDLANALAGDISALEAFPVNGGTPQEVMAIHQAHLNTNSILATLTSDFDNASCPLSDSDATTILDLLQAQVVTLQQAFMDAIAREPAIANLGDVPIFQSDFVLLKSTSDSLVAAISACISANVVPAADEIASEIDAAFASVMAAFGSS
ncbi:hypothetical protein C0993_003517 [Termitomyces sp. T159_Od127]|nr:hypothetical protein C0993_003517 [Termitomyces sp. T159_Od127]